MPRSRIQFALALPVVLALVSAGKAAAQNPDLPWLMIDTDVSVQEGDSGSTVAKVPWRLTRAADSVTSFQFRTQSPPVYGVATPGTDYDPVASTVITIPAGQTQGELEIRIHGDTEIEPNEGVELHFSNFQGVLLGGGDVTEFTSSLAIINDDYPPAPPLVGLDDHVRFDINAGAVELYPAENDIADTSFLRGATITALSQPANGELVVIQSNSPESVMDRWFYEPGPDFAGLDDIQYQVCLTDGQCAQGFVRLEGRLGPPQAGSASYAGSIRVQLDNLPAMQDVILSTSELAPLETYVLQTTVDPTPHQAWDSRAGMAWRAFTIPAPTDGIARQYRVFARYAGSVPADLRIGRDMDGDGAPSADEQACVMRESSYALQECEMSVAVSNAPVTYWVALHSRDTAPQVLDVELAQVRMDVDGPGFHATGPGLAERFDPVSVRVGWKDLLALADDEHVGFVRMRDGDDEVGVFRMATRGGGRGAIFPANSAMEIDVAASFGLEHVFLDVPGGASTLSVTVSADKPLQVLLVRMGWINGRNSIPELAPAPPGAGWVAIQPGQPRTLSVANPGLGRWYLAVQNGNQRARLAITNTVTASAPALRPGSYFNEFQPGSGLILYPAGNQWAGLWYTYSLEFGPTWYYLQAPAPGADGIWRSPIYRTTWNGSSARNVRVGEMQVTSMLADQFFMTYELDGFLGSQPMSALGRGCPALGGQVVDASSHWFDPVRAGTGYSVQTWPNYEFYAAFMYNRQGSPVFLAAEGPFVPSAEAGFPLETLQGTCPTCPYVSPPSRQAAGVLTRTLVDGTLSRIALDVDHDESPPLSGRRTWSVIDDVQPLGGAGTTQGCEP